MEKPITTKHLDKIEEYFYKCSLKKELVIIQTTLTIVNNFF